MAAALEVTPFQSPSLIRAAFIPDMLLHGACEEFVFPASILMYHNTNKHRTVIVHASQCTAWWSVEGSNTLSRVIDTAARWSRCGAGPKPGQGIHEDRCRAATG